MHRLTQIRLYLLTKQVANQSESLFQFVARILFYYTFGFIRFARFLWAMKPIRKTMAEDPLIGRLQAARLWPSRTGTVFSILIEPSSASFLRGNETIETFDLSVYQQGHSKDQRAIGLIRDWSSKVDGSAELFLRIDGPGLWIDMPHFSIQRPGLSSSGSHFSFVHISRSARVTFIGCRINHVECGKAATHISLIECEIGRLLILKESEPRVELFGSKVSSRIGEIRFGGNCELLWIRNTFVGSLAFEQGPNGGNPLDSNIVVESVRFSMRTYDGFHDGPNGYTKAREYLEKSGNSQVAHLMRAIEMETEREFDSGINAIIGGLYGYFCDYGLSPGKPLRGIVCACALSFIFFMGFDGAAVEERAAVGAWREILQPSCNEEFENLWCRLGDCPPLPPYECDGGHWKRALALALPGALFAPLTDLFVKAPLVPATWLGIIVLWIQKFFSGAMWLLFAISVRRRFKIAA